MLELTVKRPAQLDIISRFLKPYEPASLSLAERKRRFLNNLLSPSGKTKYKRYLKAPIRYAGGKSLAVGLVVELIPNNVKRVISPFLGGGSVEVACALELDLPVIGYDIFDILINYWKVQLKHPQELYKRLLKFEPNKRGFEEAKDRLKRHWKREKRLNAYDLAAHYYFNHNLSYGPGFLGWPSNIYLNKSRYLAMVDRIKNFSVPNLQVKCASFEQAFAKHPDDFFYCDPPYLLGPGTKMFRGIYPMRNIPIHHNGFNHEKLRDLLMGHKGGFILSYNDCATIRNWYANYTQFTPAWQYTMGQGETRIGKNRMNGNNNHVKNSHELLIIKMPQ